MTPGSHDGLGTARRRPRAPGVLIEIRVPELAPLRGLALDARSLPLVQRDLTCWVHAADDAAAGACSAVRTDDAGYFELAVRPSSSRIRARILASASATDTCEALEGSLRIAPRQLRRGSSLGELRMLPAPLLASGRVVDEHERPIARATVELLHRRVRSQSACRRRAGGSARRGCERWQPAPLRTTTTDEEGRFVLGAEAPGQLALRARASDHCDMDRCPSRRARARSARLTRAGVCWLTSTSAREPANAQRASAPSNDDDASKQQRRGRAGRSLPHRRPAARSYASSHAESARRGVARDRRRRGEGGRDRSRSAWSTSH